MIELLHDLIEQNCRNYGNAVCTASCRISTSTIGCCLVSSSAQAEQLPKICCSKSGLGSGAYGGVAGLGSRVLDVKDPVDVGMFRILVCTSEFLVMQLYNVQIKTRHAWASSVRRKS